jgi:hypothetical protein
MRERMFKKWGFKLDVDKVRPSTGDPKAEKCEEGSKYQCHKLTLPMYITKKWSRGGGSWFYTVHEKEVDPKDALMGSLMSLHDEARSLGLRRNDWQFMIAETLKASSYGGVGLEPRKRRDGSILLNSASINKKKKASPIGDDMARDEMVSNEDNDLKSPPENLPEDTTQEVSGSDVTMESPPAKKRSVLPDSAQRDADTMMQAAKDMGLKVTGAENKGGNVEARRKNIDNRTDSGVTKKMMEKFRKSRKGGDTESGSKKSRGNVSA